LDALAKATSHIIKLGDLMRQIKFRAWDSEIDEMVIWEHLDLDLLFSDENDCNIMQYTGLKDKSGVEIYEGDIVESDQQENMVVEYGLQEVDAFEGYGWNLWSFMENVNADGIRLQRTYKVIGNIYENKELIE
jgi:uncharacterized phage protein (TIGR01671 family)